MELTAPMFISSRLMAAVEAGIDGGVIHIEPASLRGNDGKVRWRYVIEGRNPDAFEEGDDLHSGSICDEPDARAAMRSLCSFLAAAADAYGYEQRTGRQAENADLFTPAVVEWAHQYSDELSMLAEELNDE